MLQLTLRQNDQLFSLKSSILRELGFHAVKCTSNDAASAVTAEQNSAGDVCISAGPDAHLAAILPVARTLCLREDDAYYVQPTARSCETEVSLRNEAAALSALLLNSDGRLYQEVAKACEQFGHIPAGIENMAKSQLSSQDSAIRDFTRWAITNGILTRLSPAVFPGDLRGVAAAANIAPGDCVVSVPKRLLICANAARQTDFGQALQHLPGLDDDSFLLLWLMVERHDVESLWAPFFRILPQHLHTGLTLDDTTLDLLQGTQLHSSLTIARQHVREAYAASKAAMQMLLAAYPQLLQEDWFGEDAFLWAAEFWYSTSMQVQYPDGSVQEAVVPYAALLNHSPRPHVVRYGRVNPDNQRFDLHTFRSCAEGQQCFLSYGSLENEKLLTFWGFALPNNPDDVVNVSLQVEKDSRETKVKAALQQLDVSLDHKIRKGPIPPALTVCLSLLNATELQLDALLDQPATKGRLPTTTDAWRHLARVLLDEKDALRGALDRLRNAGVDAVSSMAVTYVEGQLEVLEFGLQQCRDMEAKQGQV